MYIYNLNIFYYVKHCQPLFLTSFFSLLPHLPPLPSLWFSFPHFLLFFSLLSPPLQLNITFYPPHLYFSSLFISSTQFLLLFSLPSHSVFTSLLVTPIILVLLLFSLHPHHHPVFASLLSLLAILSVSLYFTSLFLHSHHSVFSSLFLHSTIFVSLFSIFASLSLFAPLSLSLCFFSFLLSYSFHHQVIASLLSSPIPLTSLSLHPPPPRATAF